MTERNDTDMRDAPVEPGSGQGGHVQTVCLVILAVIASAAALHWLQAVLVPFVLAMFLAIGLTPLIELLMHRLRLPRVVAVAVTLAVAVAALVCVGVLVSSSIAGLSRNAEAYQQQWTMLLDRVVGVLPLETLGLTQEEFLTPLSEASGPALRSALVNVTGAMASIVSSGSIVMIFLFFLLFGSSRQAPAPGRNWYEIQSNVRRYIVVKTLLSAATGLLVGGILWMLEVELAVVFGLLTFLLNFIPSIGSIIAVLLPLPIVVLSPTLSTVSAVLAIALPATVQFGIGNVLEPRLMGRKFDLHPVTILMALIFWGMLWGTIGMFLATPITAVIRILLARNAHTRPIAELLSGRLVSNGAAEESAKEAKTEPSTM